MELETVRVRKPGYRKANFGKIVFSKLTIKKR